MKNVKKVLLSLGVVFVFIAYSFQQRHDNSVSVIAPSSSSGGDLNGSSSRPSSSYGSNTQSNIGNSRMSMSHMYKDGSYVGDAADAFYGYIQVKAVIKDGKITDVVFLQYPNDRQNSIYINSQAMPYLKQEAIQAQNSHVNIITGATDTSQAFMQSLSSALAKA